jgi:hypothetical protein
MIGQFRAKGDWGFWGLVWEKNFLWGSLLDRYFIPPKAKFLFTFYKYFIFYDWKYPPKPIFGHKEIRGIPPKTIFGHRKILKNNLKILRSKFLCRIFVL